MPTTNRPELQADEERKLRALVHILEYFQVQEPQIPASMIEAFLLVALNEGCSLRDVWEELRDATIRLLGSVTFKDLAEDAGGPWLDPQLIAPVPNPDTTTA